MITPGSGGSGTHQKNGKSHMTQPKFKRPQPTNSWQNCFNSHGSFGGGGSKSSSSSKGPWGQSKDAKADLKGHVKSSYLDKKYETGKELFRQELRLLEQS